MIFARPGAFRSLLEEKGSNAQLISLFQILFLEKKGFHITVWGNTMSSKGSRSHKSTVTAVRKLSLLLSRMLCIQYIISNVPHLRKRWIKQVLLYFQKSFNTACDILLTVLHKKSFWPGTSSLPEFVPGNCSYQSCFLWILFVQSSLLFLQMKSNLCDQKHCFFVTFRGCCTWETCEMAQQLLTLVREFSKLSL